MSLEDFTTGFLHGLGWAWTEGRKQLGRKLQAADLTAVTSALQEDIDEFYSKHGATLDTMEPPLRGVHNASWQAGQNLARVMYNRQVFKESEWGILAEELDKDAKRLKFALAVTPEKTIVKDRTR